MIAKITYTLLVNVNVKFCRGIVFVENMTKKITGVASVAFEGLDDCVANKTAVTQASTSFEDIVDKAVNLSTHLRQYERQLS